MLLSSGCAWVLWAACACLVHSLESAPWTHQAHTSPARPELRNDEGWQNIWVIPHTHDDVGWLSTVDQYYMNEVQWILDTGVQCMADSPCYGTERRYTYVEMAYLYRWWNERPEPIRQRLRSIIQAGLLELNLAGWCMNDEATTFYTDVIDQMTEGALFVKDEIGDFASPNVGWHIDPFGHSSATAAMWADIGFDAFGLNRINFNDKDHRKQSQTLEVVWRGSKSRGAESDIFVHILAESYQTPPEMTVDSISPVPQNDPTLPTYGVNMVGIGEGVAKQAALRRPFFRHNNILLPFGDDFDHQNAYKSFQQMDKIVEYINSNSSLKSTIRYGTFGEYIRHLNTLNITWPTYEGDFFPYISGHMQYWTGYYTSRAYLKGLVRSTSAVLRAAEMLYYTAEKQQPGSMGRDELAQLGVMRRAMATLQHHDAVSGTERDAVATDYMIQLQQGRDESDKLIRRALAAIRGNVTAPPGDFEAGEEDETFTLYNSLAWPVDTVVALPINSTHYEVLAEKGKAIEDLQIVPTPKYSKDYSTAAYSVYFKPGVIPALGYRMVTLRKTSGAPTGQVTYGQEVPAGHDITISNSYYKLIFNGTTHELSTLTSANGRSVALNQEFAQYTGAFLVQLDQPRSGAYIFRPQPGNRSPTTYVTNRIAMDQWKFLDGPLAADSPQVKWPLVLVSGHTPNFEIQASVYTVSTLMTNTTDTNFVMCRVDPPESINPPPIIHEEVSTDYLVLDDTGPLEKVKGDWQSGTALVHNSSTWCSAVEVQFPSTFTQAPLVLASTEVHSAMDSVTSKFAPAFAVTVTASSVSSASFNVCRADYLQNPAPWDDTVYVNWFAMDRDAQLPPTQRMGTKSNILGPPLGTVAQFNVDFMQKFPVFEASVIVTVQARGSRAFAVSTAVVTGDGFLASVCALDELPGNWDSNDVTVNWYAFEPEDIQAAVSANAPTTEVVNGPLVSEVRQTYRDRYAITTRLYHGESDYLHKVERVYEIGALDTGRELVTRFKTDIATDSCFTDDNGLEMVNRTYSRFVEDDIAGNYFPMVKAAEIRDKATASRLVVMGDRSHGLGCHGNGQFEIMLQRRTVGDDNCGLNEALNEVVSIQPRLWMVFESDDVAVKLRQKLSLQLQYPIHIIQETKPVHLHTFSALTQPFPDSINLLPLKVRNSTQLPSKFILRVENLYEIDDPGSPASVLLALNGTFPSSMQPKILDETNLTADRLRSAVKRLKWKTQGDRMQDEANSESEYDGTLTRDSEDAATITLGPRQMKTYIVT
ncbi:lysosomal alpha-mannosidase-like [Sycon ciliatum]|uniref:lysosomal alpha-mannosidase-like n=1 Tax=Sycon ciliatum TaxID=27933 RepID=UPI0031F70319